jgi:hypothetical protein
MVRGGGTALRRGAGDAGSSIPDCGELAMMRGLAVVGALLALALFVGAGTAADKGAKNNQMVKGTIKSVDVATGVLVVNQKVKDETVERQLNITDATQFEITFGDEKKEATGKDGLALLADSAGASVAVKCDKDVNVLKVTAKVKK